MDSRVAQFHTIRVHAAGTLVVYEPMRGTYVWIELRVPLRLRGTGCAREIASAALSFLPGTHFVEFDPAIRTFAEIARSRRWRLRGNSAWFAGCLSYLVRSRGSQQLSTKARYSHKTYGTCPKVTSFRSVSALNNCIQLIRCDIEKLILGSTDA